MDCERRPGRAAPPKQRSTGRASDLRAKHAGESSILVDQMVFERPGNMQYERRDHQIPDPVVNRVIQASQGAVMRDDLLRVGRVRIAGHQLDAEEIDAVAPTDDMRKPDRGITTVPMSRT